MIDSSLHQVLEERKKKKIREKNKKFFSSRIQTVEDYFDTMEILPGRPELPLEIDFQEEQNNINPFIYILKSITLGSTFKKVTGNNDNDAEVTRVSAPYGHLNVVYENETKSQKSRFYIEGLKLSNKIVPLTKESDNALAETIKSAFLLANTAKAAGWTEINFGKTKDPLKIAALKAACDKVGLKISPSQEIPNLKSEIYSDKFKVMFEKAVNHISKNPLYSVILDEPKAENDQTPMSSVA